MTSAQLCKSRGFKVGDILRLKARSGFGNSVFTIKITAIGESAILARRKGAAERDVHDMQDYDEIEKVAKHD
jgi:hypothetical protein